LVIFTGTILTFLKLMEVQDEGIGVQKESVQIIFLPELLRDWASFNFFLFLFFLFELILILEVID